MRPFPLPSVDGLMGLKIFYGVEIVDFLGSERLILRYGTKTQGVVP